MGPPGGTGGADYGEFVTIRALSSFLLPGVRREVYGGSQALHRLLTAGGAEVGS
jgi:hypothetical protein